MTIESVGLMIAFLLISIILLWILIRSRTSIIIKFLLIFAVLWYGIVLLNIPANFMGWPKPLVETDYKGQYIKDYFILEPMEEREGFIYFWLIDQVRVEEIQILLKNKIILTEMFLIKWIGVPRAYSLKYSRDLHKKILETDKKVKNMPGGLIKIKGLSDKEEGKEDSTKIEFEIINPRDIFIKDK